MNTGKFQKKPVVIEAYQTDVERVIETLEGAMKASVGDWIITGVNGEQYPCKPDIFEKTYERVDDMEPVAEVQLSDYVWAGLKDGLPNIPVKHKQTGEEVIFFAVHDIDKRILLGPVEDDGEEDWFKKCWTVEPQQFLEEYELV